MPDPEPENPMSNPFLEDWSTPFGIPPFGEIGVDHFRDAFDMAIAEWRAEVEVIATNPAPPIFDNTIAALELSGERLDKVAAVFFNLCSANTSPELQEIEAEVAPVLARNSAEINMDTRLFDKIDTLQEARETLDLTSEQRQVLNLYHEGYVRAGAKLDEAGRSRMTAIMERLAALGASFSKNLLADEADLEIVVDDRADLAGLPQLLIEAAAKAAEDRGKPGKFAITASRSSMEPFLQFAERRDLREAAWRAFVSRGETRDETATADIIAETMALRQERARLLGFATFAHYKLDNQMAKNPENVANLLNRVWDRASASAVREREKLQALAAEEGGNFAVEPWDWAFHAEKLRKRDLDLDDSEVKPYMQLDSMIEAAFDTANRLFGLSFAELPDAPRHHPDARVWEVTGRDGEHVGVFIGDYFARSSKRSGAWMSTFRDQHKLSGNVRPIVVNTMNFSKPAAGGAALLTFDDARTLFHEFGHGLHGLMSDVTYPRISGTSVARDFVELPSQLYEHWLMEPSLLRRFARHVDTGEAMPDDLLEKLRKAQTFDKGGETVQYLASAIVDLELHRSEIGEGFDPAAFERETLERIGMPGGLVMRHRTPHFAHVFSGDGYSSGYYSYMWSEVMDADAFGAFEDAGDAFDRSTADALAEHIYSAGGQRDPEEAYKAFRGRGPEPDALLRRRGLLDDAA
jgi:peptidyl-dipeptidase Dcp